jgi:hypothetical protein
MPSPFAESCKVSIVTECAFSFYHKKSVELPLSASLRHIGGAEVKLHALLNSAFVKR